MTTLFIGYGLTENLAITTPLDRYPESAVRVSKVSLAARTSPKS
jgi:hypothetical protein